MSFDMQLWLQAVLEAWEMPNFMQSLLLLYTQTSLRYFEHLLFKPWFYRNNFLMPHLRVPMPKSYVTATGFDFMGPQI